MRKSRAERTFQSYLKEKEFQDKLEFRPGIMPYGGVKVGCVLFLRDLFWSKRSIFLLTKF